MAKLVDSITEPAAKSAILWVLGEYSERVPKIAPDVLRKLAKSFPNEEPQVKLQVLNLALKLCLTNPKQTKLLAQYVFNLAKYDVNYDIRDRARFMRVFLFPPPGQENNKLIKHAKKIFLATKPAPASQSKFLNRQTFQLGSMSHYLNAKVNGYQDLPEFPEIAPDSSVRNVEPPKAPNPWEKTVEANKAKKKEALEKKRSGFYSESASSSSSSSSQESDEEEIVQQKNENTLIMMEESQDSESDSSSSESESESSQSSEEEVVVQKKNGAAQKPKTNLDLLLDLDDSGKSKIDFVCIFFS